jgi:hypothetical protein
MTDKAEGSNNADSFSETGQIKERVIVCDVTMSALHDPI